VQFRALALCVVRAGLGVAADGQTCTARLAKRGLFALSPAHSHSHSHKAEVKVKGGKRDRHSRH